MLPITHVSFPSRTMVAAACGRFGEFADHPEFKEKVFGWEDLRKWELDRYGSFRYMHYWEGFTLSGRDLAPFREGRFNPLTEPERRLLALLSDAEDGTTIIACAEGDRETFAHELVHALFEREPAYRADVDAAFGNARLPNLRRELRAMGYPEEALLDEANAYLATALEPGMRGWQESLHGLRARRLLKKHFGWDPRRDVPPALADRIRTRRFHA